MKTKEVSDDTLAQPTDIAYPKDADLSHVIREKIVKPVQPVHAEITLRRPFRSFVPVSKRIYLRIKKIYLKNPEKREKAVKALQQVVTRVVHQDRRVARSFYIWSRKDLGRPPDSLLSLGRRAVGKTAEVLRVGIIEQRLFSSHRPDVTVINKRKNHPFCEPGSLKTLAPIKWLDPLSSGIPPLRDQSQQGDSS